MDGWIKLHRQISNSSVFSDPELLRLWLLCLMKATHKGTSIVIDRQQVDLLPGEFVTGRKALTDDYNTGLKPRHRKKELSIWRDLKFLEECGNVNIKTTNKFSVVSVSKWCEYQESEQQVNNNRTTSEQQVNTNKNVKNEKNVKKEKETKIAYSENVTLTELEYQNLCEKYGKGLTDSSISFLTSYKIEKGYKTKSDNLTIQRWVIDAVRKTKGLPIQPSNPSPKEYVPDPAILEEMRELERLRKAN